MTHRRTRRDFATLARHEQQVLAVVARCEGHNGFFPSYTLFRRWFGMTHSQLKATVISLRRQGLIAVSGQPGISDIRVILTRAPDRPIAFPAPVRRQPHNEAQAA